MRREAKLRGIQIFQPENFRMRTEAKLPGIQIFQITSGNVGFAKIYKRSIPENLILSINFFTLRILKNDPRGVVVVFKV